MSHSRNLVTVMVLLLVGLFVTTAHFYKTAGSTPATIQPALVVVTGGESTFSGEAVTVESVDREVFITEMKKELALRSGEDSTLPLIVEDAVTEEPEEGGAGEQIEGLDREVAWCDATVLESQFLSLWPTAEVSVVVREGARVILAEVPDLVTASGTVSQPPLPLMQFMTSPTLRDESACLTHGYIGVTVDGRLIHNNDVVLYQSYKSEQLVGYAFDGNPIYGVSATTNSFDNCGGTETTGGYQYHIRTDEGFILACFASEPQQSTVSF